MRRALAIDEKSFGPDHPNVAMQPEQSGGLARRSGALGRGGCALCSRAKPIMIGAHGDAANAKQRRAGKSGACAEYQALEGLCAGALSCRRERCRKPCRGLRAGAMGAAKRGGGCALRHGRRALPKAARNLAKLVREQQDLLGAREAAYRSLDAAAGKADAKAAETARASYRGYRGQARREASRNCAKLFPIMRTWPIRSRFALADAQALLGEGEALVLFLDLLQYGKVPEETIVFALTKKEARWTSIGLGSKALRERVMALRCGLDSSNWRAGKKPGSLQAFSARR